VFVLGGGSTDSPLFLTLLKPLKPYKNMFRLLLSIFLPELITNEILGKKKRKFKRKK
jgi:hypothetical protein